MTRRLAAVLGGLTLVAVAGCAAVQVPPLPPEAMPTAWAGPIPDDAQEWPDADWWEAFRSPELTTLVQRAFDTNLDLANNARNLEAAQITLREAGFNLWPTPSVSISTSTSYSRSRNDGTTVSNSSSGPFNLTGQLSYNNIISKPVTYDRATVDYTSRVAQAASMRLNTLTTVASTYFSVLMIRDQMVAAEQNLENAIQIGEIANARLAAGISVPIDALQQQIAIESQRTQLSSLKQQELSALASLALLLGQTVHDFDVEGQTLDLVNVPYVRPGIPSELLNRRPDLVQAEASVRSSALNVRAVRLNFFPQISLTGSDSVRSQSLTSLVSSPATTFNIGANLAQTLLDNGQRRRNVEQARISLENAIANYQKSVITAFNQVEVELSRLELLEEQAAVARRNLQAAEESFRIAELRYTEGIADYQTMLNSMNSLFQTRTSLLSNKQQRLSAILTLYTALGGGWNVVDDPAFQ